MKSAFLTAWAARRPCMGLSVLVRGPSQRLLQASGVWMGRSPGSSEPLTSSPGAF